MQTKYLLLILVFPLLILSQSKNSSFEDDLEHAFVNAKKGIYYSLNNIPESKSSLRQDLIEEDKLIAEIKLSKETNGVRVESLGHFKTYSVEITIYRSYDSLEKEGYR